MSAVAMNTSSNTTQNRRSAAAAVLGAAIAAACGANAAAATPGIDGAVDVANNEYGPALAVQNNGTGYGNNFSELNQLFANYAPNGDLKLALTGNLEQGGNGLLLFVDSKAGGGIANSVGGGFGQFGSLSGTRTDDWGTDTDGGTGVSTPSGGGSVMAPNFNPDYSIEINVFGSSYYTNIIDLTVPNHPDSVNRDRYLGENAVGTSSPAGAVEQIYNRDGAPDSGTIEHAYDSTNTDGVTDTDPSGATTGLKGFEFNFENQFLALTPGHALRVMAVITNLDGAYVSNQLLPGVGPGSPNLDNPGGAGGAPLFDARVYNDRFYVPIFVPTLSSGTTWASGTWTGNFAPNGAEHAARLNGTTNQTIAIPAGLKLGFLEFANPGQTNVGSYTLATAGILDLDGGPGAAAVFVNNGSHAINTRVNLTTDARVNVAAGSTLSFGGLSMAANKRLTKAGAGTLNISGPMFNAQFSSLAADVGTVNLSANLGANLAGSDRPDLFVSTPGGGPGAVVNLSADQQLDSVAVNPNGQLNLLANGSRTLVAETVSTGGNGRIDLADNNMVVKSTPLGSAAPGPNDTRVYSGVSGMIQSGFVNGQGDWSGPGIVTSMEAAQGGLVTLGSAIAGEVLPFESETILWGGQTVSMTDTIVMYTHAGDANLDGAVDGGDYAFIDAYVGSAAADAAYYKGDFNYDGFIDGGDYAYIDVTVGAAPMPAGQGGGLTAVPEPASLSALGAAATLLLARRRRRAR